MDKKLFLVNCIDSFQIGYNSYIEQGNTIKFVKHSFIVLAENKDHAVELAGEHVKNNEELRNLDLNVTEVVT